MSLTSRHTGCGQSPHLQPDHASYARCEEIGEMRDLLADWRKWSSTERLLAVVLMVMLLGLPLRALISVAPFKAGRSSNCASLPAKLRPERRHLNQTEAQYEERPERAQTQAAARMCTSSPPHMPSTTRPPGASARGN